MAVVQIADPRFPNNDRQVGVNTVHSDGVTAAQHDSNLNVTMGMTDFPSFVVPFTVAPVGSIDVFEVYSAVNTILRLRRIVIVNPGSATAAATVDLSLGVATGAGSGGAVGSAIPVDSSPRTAGVTGGPDSTAPSVRLGDTTLAGGYSPIYNPLVSITVPAAAGGFTPLTIYDGRDPSFKNVTSQVTKNPAAITVLRIGAVGAGAANFRGYAEFVMDSA